MKKYSSIIFLFLFILVSVLFKLFFLGQELKDKILLSNTLDFSWQTDSVERFLHGFIAGRDFIFTYGPLFQFFASVPSLIFNQPSYISVLLYPILLTILICIGLFFIITCVTKDKKIQIIVLAYLLFIIDVNAFDSNTLFRVILPFVYILLYDKYASIRKTFSFSSLIILFLPTFFGLYTYDLFFICLISTTLVMAFDLFSNKKTFFFALFQIAVICSSAVIMSFVLTNNLNYLIYSLDTVTNYQFVMNIPLTINKSALLFLFPLSLLFLAIALIKQKQNIPQKRTFLILSLMALLQLKSAFIRADEGHIIMGIYPSLIITFILLFFFIQKKLRRSFAILFIFLYLLIPHKNNYYEIISLDNLKTATTLFTQHLNFSDIYRFSETYPYTKNDFTYFASLAKDNPGKVMAYPYDTYLLNISDQTYNSLPLQFYQYAGTAVEEETVRRFKQSSPQFIILGIDTKGAVMLDDIPNFSRNPLIAQWMMNNYSVERKAKNYLVLRFDPHKKVKRATNDCTVYTVAINGMIKTTFFEKMSKPSLYYFTEPFDFRIPYTEETDEVFIIEKHTDVNYVTKLFEERRDFEKPSDKKELTVEILKQYPLPKLTQTITGKLEAKCY